MCIRDSHIEIDEGDRDRRDHHRAEKQPVADRVEAGGLHLDPPISPASRPRRPSPGANRLNPDSTTIRVIADRPPTRPAKPRVSPTSVDPGLAGRGPGKSYEVGLFD